MSSVFSVKQTEAFRKELHRYPELSGKEKNTAERIVNFLKPSKPDQVIHNLGGHGLAFVFDSKQPGPVVLFRTDMDALPIQEINTVDYASQSAGVAHKCGHDGHMAIMAHFAGKISENRPKRGKVILLFQPAEETGEGAEKVIKDMQFEKIKPDMAFALHNLPGFARHSIIFRENTFASASKGIIIKLKGVTSHAGEPENGINPAKAMADIMNQFLELPESPEFRDFTLVTLIHARLGERAFGTSAGYGEVMATLRSYRNDDMELLTEKAERIAGLAAEAQKLKFEIEYTEEFPATVNDDKCNSFVWRVAKDEDLEIVSPETPFRWSEDFGQFSDRFPSALFGLGSGTEQPQLHNPDYDFPDEIIETGARMFFNIYKKILVVND